MNISNKEKNLLIVVVAILLGVLYYCFVYTSQVESIDTKKKELAEIQEKYEKAKSDIDTLESRKQKVEEKVTTSITKTSMLYPTLIQENIQLEINKIIKDCELEVDYGFSPIKVEELQYLTPMPEMLPFTVFQPSVNSVKNQVLVEAQTDEEKVGATVGVTCEHYTVTLKIKKATDANLVKFLQTLEDSERMITVTNMALAPKTEDELEGTLTFEFYGVPKLASSKEDESYLEWTLKNIYGKDRIFSTGAASGSIEDKNKKGQNDFVAMLKSPASEMNTFSMGRANDKVTATYIYNDSSDVIDVNLTITEVDGKLYFKYSTPTSNYPTTGSEYGEEFTPNDKDIRFEVISEARTGTDDTSGINLHIVNNTADRKIIVKKTDDDSTNPRINVTQEGGTVNVI